MKSEKRVKLNLYRIRTLYLYKKNKKLDPKQSLWAEKIALISTPYKQTRNKVTRVKRLSTRRQPPANNKSSLLYAIPPIKLAPVIPFTNRDEETLNL